MTAEKVHGDLLGRIGEGPLQFKIVRHPRVPDKKFPFFPFIGWFWPEKRTPEYTPPPKCKCRYVLRADALTVKAAVLLGIPPGAFICRCWGDFIE